MRRGLAALVMAGGLVALAAGASAQVPPTPTPNPTANPAPSAEQSTASPSPSASPTAPPTPPPIEVSPAAGTVPVGQTQNLTVSRVLGDITLTIADPTVVGASVNQSTRVLTLTGKTPGSTTVTVADSRGLTRDVPVRVAYLAGTIAVSASLQLTGDPASQSFVKTQVVALARKLAQARDGAQIVTSTDDVVLAKPLAQDNVVDVSVPVLIQGEGFFPANGSTRVYVENVAAPRIAPDQLMVSDFPETLTEDGILFTADLAREVPSRFLYFHANPIGQPNRRIVLRAENQSSEPATVQFIEGRADADPNELAVGHDSTKRFVVHLLQNEGSLIVIPANASLNLDEQDLPAGTVVSNLLQLRVLNGGVVHLTLFAQDAGADPNESLTSDALLTGAHAHARGVYGIPEFHYAAQWRVTDPFLELSVGQIPLPNQLEGQALSGDYGVLQSFVVNVQNPLPEPQAIAIYENPRGGRATGTFLIDGVLLQSHQTVAFSRYKLRQYVVPAKGFVRLTIVTMPEAGSSYPLKLIVAPDDGSVAPGAPGSPVY
ncbi:MAG TPA: Ig-like domain-containing protein [Candidatus Baltobacteraceae bacterium]